MHDDMRMLSLGLILVAGLVACTSPPAVGSQIAATSPPPASANPREQAAPCDVSAVRSSVDGFVRAWNQNNANALHGILASKAELAMSAKGQGTRSSKSDGYTTLDGWRRIRRFATRQWALGERLSFSRLQVFGGSSKGAYARGMRASYSDGSRQVMADAKFVYSCTEHALARIVLVAWERAR